MVYCKTYDNQKDVHIKALEDEVLRLKELYSNVSPNEQKLAEENMQLKTLHPNNQRQYTIEPQFTQFTTSGDITHQFPAIGITVASRTAEIPAMASSQAIARKRRAEYSDTKCDQCRKDKQKVPTYHPFVVL